MLWYLSKTFFVIHLDRMLNDNPIKVIEPEAFQLDLEFTTVTRM